MASADFYGADLAGVHAAAFEGLAQAAGRALLGGLSVREGRVLDLGCGAGALSRLVADAGLSPWGVDVSAAMLEIARRRVPEGEFVQGSVFEVEPPQAIAACAVGEVVNYLTADADDPARLGALFARLHAALRPGGLLLFDAAAPGRAGGGGRAFTEAADWAVGAISEEDGQGVLTRRITSFRRLDDGRWRRAHEIHRLRLWPTAMVMAQLQAAGFAAETMAAYGDLRLPAGLVAYAARKPERS
ncbi:MAG: class I SAM-dependent methyltransferase [Phenylobacterium sp.]|uniref:class I SAM-dependent methyltransferase n=1 Tax=Phenylobacterium sp. TaxID=1871053 RepID=UPI00391B8F50